MSGKLYAGLVYSAFILSVVALILTLADILGAW